MSNFEKMLQESILNPKAQSFIDSAVKEHGDAGYRHHDHIFGDKKDMVIPLGNDEWHRHVDVNAIHPSIKQTLAKHGFGIHDYVNNVAVRTKIQRDGSLRDERPAISTILSREKDGEALKHFNNDPQRKSRMSGDHEIVISRDPQKVGRMTSSRRWSGEHCTRLPGPEMKHPERTGHISPQDIDTGGMFHHTVAQDIKHGTMIAYLVKKGDHNVEDPLGRILLKKHRAIDTKTGHPTGEHIWRPETYHDFGHSPDNFKATVSKWAENHYPALQGGQKALKYTKHHDLYDDSPSDQSSDFIARAKGKHVLTNRNGSTTSMHVNDSSQLHNPHPDVPARVTERPLMDRREEHFKAGVPHRDDDKPQEVHHEFGDSGMQMTKQIWRKKGLVHREGDQPAIIEHHNSGNTTYTHMKYDMKHRDSKLGPAEYSSRHSAYYMNGMQHRPSAEGPSAIDHHGHFEHREYGKLVRPENGAPSSGELSARTFHWAPTEHEPEVKLHGEKLMMEHKDGSVERFEKGVRTHLTADLEVTKRPMTNEEHAMHFEYMRRSKLAPTFKPHQPPA